MSVKFEHFLSKFPEVELPITLSDDVHHDFSKENDPLQPLMIEEYITRYEATEPDEMTEYVACFQMPIEKKDFKAVVYWKAGLLNYDYVLATYNPQTGVMIDKRAIAGTKVVGNAVKRIVAFVKEDFTIHVAEGVEDSALSYNADSTKVRRFEMLENGRIEQDY